MKLVYKFFAATLAVLIILTFILAGCSKDSSESDKDGANNGGDHDNNSDEFVITEENAHTAMAESLSKLLEARAFKGSVKKFTQNGEKSRELVISSSFLSKEDGENIAFVRRESEGEHYDTYCVGNSRYEYCSEYSNECDYFFCDEPYGSSLITDFLFYELDGVSFENICRYFFEGKYTITSDDNGFVLTRELASASEMMRLLRENDSYNEDEANILSELYENFVGSFGIKIDKSGVFTALEYDVSYSSNGTDHKSSVVAAFTDINGNFEISVPSWFESRQYGAASYFYMIENGVVCEYGYNDNGELGLCAVYTDDYSPLTEILPLIKVYSEIDGQKVSFVGSIANYYDITVCNIIIPKEIVFDKEESTGFENTVIFLEGISEEYEFIPDAKGVYFGGDWQYVDSLPVSNINN